MDNEQQMKDTLDNARKHKTYVCTSEEGEEFTVHLLTAKVRHIPKITKLLKTFMQMRNIISVDQAMAEASKIVGAEMNLQSMMEHLNDDLLDDVADALVSLTTLTSKDQVLDMEIDDLVKICMACFEVNRSFFMKRLNLLEKGNQ